MKTNTAEFNELTFAEVFDSVDKFLKDYKDNGLDPTISDEYAKKLYWLLYGLHANDPMNSSDENTFKYKIWGIIFKSGAYWQRQLEIQNAIRGMSLEDAAMTSKTINNNALNPGERPSTQTMDELNTINSQNVVFNKKGILDSYDRILMLLESDVTSEFLDKFKICFKRIVEPDITVLYGEEC